MHTSRAERQPRHRLEILNQIKMQTMIDTVVDIAISLYMIHYLNLYQIIFMSLSNSPFRGPVNLVKARETQDPFKGIL